MIWYTRGLVWYFEALENAEFVSFWRHRMDAGSCSPLLEAWNTRFARSVT